MKNRQIRVYGIVQGVGYRPFIAELAESLGLCGTVENSGGIVTICISGKDEAMDEMVHRLPVIFPEGARVDRVEVTEGPEQEFDAFRIIESSELDVIPLLPADIATCKICEGELKNPEDRRFRHPFISCVACGPRYSIMERVPYDRPTITMREFPLCKKCEEEYMQKGNRRRHAQTIACKECGPRLFLEDKNGQKQEGEEAIAETVSGLKDGKILAIKDIGGYHLAVSPEIPESVKKLRQLKGREKKPFAVMFASLNQIREYCEVSKLEEEALLSPARPIVLLRKKKDFCEEVCGDSPDIGAMLPCNPLQILLLEQISPLIMTSANVSGEPIIIEEQRVRDWMKEDERLGGMLWNDRKILAPLDDSILRVIGGKTQVFRRARGFVPEVLEMPVFLEKQCFAAGGDLKSVFAYGVGNRAYLSQHFGDLEDVRAREAYLRERDRMKTLFSFRPQHMVKDKHPAYYSGKMMEKDKPVLSVQHHFAHAASVLAEHGLDKPAVAVVFDGTGYGEDGTVWGGEFLYYEKGTFNREGHLETVTLIGGDEGAKNGRTIAAGYRRLAGLEAKDEKEQVIIKALDLGFAGIASTSSGRLFDAVSSLLDICYYNDYEGEGAIRLEAEAQKAKQAVKLTLPVIDRELKTGALIRELAEKKEMGYDRKNLARGFHEALAESIVKLSEQIAKEKETEIILLSGGTFQNRILLELVVDCLKKDGFQVYWNEKVPPGDGGIALGQLYLAGKEGQ